MRSSSLPGPQIQHWLHNLSKREQWRHLLRATLRECTYLPDPIARIYMKDHILSRYRAASSRSNKAGPQTVHTARNALSVLRRANEGYSRPLEKVLFLSYGRTGRRRHELLAKMLTPQIPNDTLGLQELLSQPAQFGDCWEAPAIVRSLAAAHMQNTVVTSARIRPLIKHLKPPIPQQNTWCKEVPESRRRNIRRRWYNSTLNSLLPPLPEDDLRILDGLISGTVPWSPVKRRKVKTQIAQTESESKLFTLLARGPEKGKTFAEYVNGRPHTLTARYMRRQWRRLSALIPRPSWNSEYQKWSFTWETPKAIPRLSPGMANGIDPASIFEMVAKAKSGVSREHRAQ
ncbi:uncharacterized protein N7515_000526 [Penicillium bovifimosum]|uniref:LYR motif-containing protein Cup1-like N-terminal domain-containing protein n=1 Tax=Penicillium bovifimosum TaxID=126998 RepID=A0A9W9LB60_9EURO|nr:uncharacterized protein N7515_000526 [Penicillium bovifimosum]KAJ5145962.1 hypothetical protein N7515_000526 [Penicillium bovifimosum]